MVQDWRWYHPWGCPYPFLHCWRSTVSPKSIVPPNSSKLLKTDGGHHPQRSILPWYESGTPGCGLDVAFNESRDQIRQIDQFVNSPHSSDRINTWYVDRLNIGKLSKMGGRRIWNLVWNQQIYLKPKMVLNLFFVCWKPRLSFKPKTHGKSHFISLLFVSTLQHIKVYYSSSRSAVKCSKMLKMCLSPASR